MIKIFKLEDCCGCSSCVQVCPKQCISFNEDRQGFRYPIVDAKKCINCGLCEKACPILKPGYEKIPLFVYAAKNKDEDIRRFSSSGGIFSLLAEHVICEGGFVFGAKFDDNWEVVHDYTNTLEGLSVFRGSKYLQSRVEDSFQKVKLLLNKGLTVLFSGSPCQIAGLKSYLQKNYDNLICVDFVCHGVPSPMVWRQYIKEIVSKSNNQCLLQRFISKSSALIESVNFRDKSSGWKNFSFSVNLDVSSAQGKKDKITLSSIFYQNVYMKAFLKNLILRPSCFECRFRSGKSGSDITLGDFWGIDKYRPEYADDLGVGLVMINSDKGNSLFSSTDADFILMKYDEAKESNICIFKSCNRHAMYNYFFSRCNYALDLHQLIDRCILYKPDYLYRILRKVKLVK